MHHRHHPTRLAGAGVLAALLCLTASAAGAFTSYFSSRCASCHSDDTPTCAGCHAHRGALNAAADAGAYFPGDPVTVTLTGGSHGGWVRGILYDQNDMVVALAAGPTQTGDDGMGDPVVFPVLMHGTAPSQPGDHVWEAAWYGGLDSGAGHTEVRRTVTIHVLDPTGAPEAPGEAAGSRTTWSALRALF